MPRYDYACISCGHVIEVMHGVNDGGPARCERCGGEMRKLVSSVAIHFKGSGWAKKDARPARTPGAAKSATDTDGDHRPAAQAETAKNESGGDSKPAQSSSAPATDKGAKDTTSGSGS